MQAKDLPVDRRGRYAGGMTERSHELMRDNRFMRDFYAACAREITREQLIERHRVTVDDVRSIARTIQAQRNGSPKNAPRKTPGKQIDAKVDAASVIETADFLSDFARYSEGILDEKYLRRKYKQFDNNVWEKLGSDDRLVEAIETEKVRRMRNGDSAREKAQQIFVAAPNVLGGILTDNGANARHRIEASKELRTIANVGPESTPSTDRFQITIVLNADGSSDPHDVIKFDKARAIGIEDDAAPQELVAIDKPTENGGGNAL
jgi:hypothetical protein